MTLPGYSLILSCCEFCRGVNRNVNVLKTVHIAFSVFSSVHYHFTGYLSPTPLSWKKHTPQFASFQEILLSLLIVGIFNIYCMYEF